MYKKIGIFHYMLMALLSIPHIMTEILLNNANIELKMRYIWLCLDKL